MPEDTAVGISTPPAWNFGSSFGSRAAPPGEALGSNDEKFGQHYQKCEAERQVQTTAGDYGENPRLKK